MDDLPFRRATFRATLRGRKSSHAGAQGEAVYGKQAITVRQILTAGGVDPRRVAKESPDSRNQVDMAVGAIAQAAAQGHGPQLGYEPPPSRRRWPLAGRYDDLRDDGVVLSRVPPCDVRHSHVPAIRHSQPMAVPVAAPGPWRHLHSYSRGRTRA